MIEMSHETVWSAKEPKLLSDIEVLTSEIERVICRIPCPTPTPKELMEALGPSLQVKSVNPSSMTQFRVKAWFCVAVATKDPPSMAQLSLYVTLPSVSSCGRSSS